MSSIYQGYYFLKNLESQLILAPQKIEKFNKTAATFFDKICKFPDEKMQLLVLQKLQKKLAKPIYAFEKNETILDLKEKVHSQIVLIQEKYQLEKCGKEVAYTSIDDLLRSMQTIVDADVPIKDKISQISKLFQWKIEKGESPPIVFLFFATHCHFNSSNTDNIKSLMELHSFYFQSPKDIYVVLACEMLMHLMDPSGAIRLEIIESEPKASLIQKCIEIGKIQYILQHTRGTQSSLFNQFQLKTEEFIKKHAAKSSSSDISSSAEVLQKCHLPLSSDEMEALADELYFDEAKLFIKFEEYEFLQFEKRLQGEFDNLFNHENLELEDKANILGNWLHIAQRCVQEGNLNTAFIMYMSIASTEHADANAFEKISEDAQYRAIYEFLEKFFEPKSKLLREYFDFQFPDRPIIPLIPQNFSAIKRFCELGYCSAAERVFHDISLIQMGVKIWIEIHGKRDSFLEA
ncbi:MAG: hypothetical protein Tsb0015_15900 [Simkaniaceae bacterium]